MFNRSGKDIPAAKPTAEQPAGHTPLEQCDRCPDLKGHSGQHLQDTVAARGSDPGLDKGQPEHLKWSNPSFEEGRE
ncbi:hypothetical protein HDE_13040 [Halotydeus destructor]|nr:hypothetical protein HDE_13040 [Halotydeus destructor]